MSKAQDLTNHPNCSKIALTHGKLVSKRETGCTLQPVKLAEVIPLVHTALSRC